MHLFILLFLFTSQAQEPDFWTRWDAAIKAATRGDATATEELERAFRAATRENKETFAIALADRCPKCTISYRDYLRVLVDEVLAENAPFPFALDDRTSAGGYAPEFLEWCRERGVEPEAAAETVAARYPARMYYCTGSPADVGRLLRALELRNHAVVQAAASQLAGLEQKQTAGAILAAARRVPYFYRVGMAEALALLDTRDSWRMVESLIRDRDIRAYLREKVAQARQEKRARTAKP